MHEIGDMVPRCARLARIAAAQSGPLRRQHAQRRGNRRRQSRGAERLRLPVNGYGVGDLAERIDQFTDAEVDRLCRRISRKLFDRQGARVAPTRSRRRADRTRPPAFLAEGGFGAFTDTFEDLHGLGQLPGIAAQRLMADGYGFGGEGDWKTAALVRIMKVMARASRRHLVHGGLHLRLRPATPKVLGSHMLEICPSIADGQAVARGPSARYRRQGRPGAPRLHRARRPGRQRLVVDMGNRFRMIVNEVDVIAPEQPLPKLPVARALWHPAPNLKVAAAAWIYAGGAHHTGFSQALTMEHLEDFAEIAGIEMVRIDTETPLHNSAANSSGAMQPYKLS